MLRFLIRFLVFGGILAMVVTFAVVYLRSHKKKKTLPSAKQAAPEHWQKLATQDLHLAEALALRESLRVLVGKQRSLVGPELLVDVDAIIDPLVGLVELRQEVIRCADNLDNIGGQKQPSTSANMVQRLTEHEQRLGQEAGQMVDTLRSVYLDLIDGTTSTAIDRDTMNQRAKELAANVRTRIEAESEVREILAHLDRGELGPMPEPFGTEKH
ncbi:MAG: hypothetical protein HUU55_16605 [Myxococcales bacterium]|nr:hypothetical protein [Myxococcales bacterium]